MRVALVGLLVAAIGLPACRHTPTEPSSFAVPLGRWNGPQARLIVEASGARFESHCSVGIVPTRLRVDAQRRFDVGGTFRVEDRGWQYGDLPARYTGTLHGESLTLSIEVTGPRRQLGPYEVRLGAPDTPFSIC